MTRSGTSSARRRAVRARFLPRLLPLESRDLPATFVVTSPLDSGPGTLRQAIFQANGAAGADRVVFNLGPGARTITLTGGPLTITDSLTIDGPGAGRLTISAGGNSAVLVAHPAAPPPPTTPTIAVRVSGLTIADGRASADPDSGGGISAVQTDLTVADSAFRNNRAAVYGGAIAAYPAYYQDSQGNFVAVPGSLTISNSSFEANAAAYGGAVAAFDIPAVITGSTFDGNAADSGGGAVFGGTFTEPDATLSIGGSSFTHNDSGPGSGGAIYIGGQSATIADTAFRGNEAGFGGGAIYNAGTFSGPPTSLTIEGSSFEANAAINPASFALGGAVFNGGTLTVRDSAFAGNRAVAPGGAQGGAIHNDFSAAMTVEDSLFRDNLARSDGASDDAAGGALSGDAGSSITVLDSRFLGNRSEALTNRAVGGAIKNSGEGFSVVDVGTLTIRGSLFEGNAAVGLELSPWGQGASAAGGAVFNESGPVDVSGTTFRDNLAQGASGGASGTGGFATGGGLANQGGGPLTLTGSLFLGNRAVSGSGGSAFLGGGFAVGGGLVDQFRFSGPSSTITDTWFVDNAAVGGDGLGEGTGGPAWGGGLAFSGTPANLTRVHAVGNRADGGDGGTGGEGLGGGLYVSGQSVMVAGSQFVANRAEGGDSTTGGTAGGGRGGAIYGSGAELTLDRSQLIGNRAIGGTGSAGGDAEGGGLWAIGAATITDTVIVGNRADAGPAGRGYGGGIFLASGTTVAINKKTKVIGNQATTAGDNIYRAP